jgi:hypothetical protein
MNKNEFAIFLSLVWDAEKMLIPETYTKSIFQPYTLNIYIRDFTAIDRLQNKYLFSMSILFSGCRRTKIQKTVRRRKNEMTKTGKETKIRIKRRRNELSCIPRIHICC